MLLELRHAVRRLRRSPGFTAVAIGSLALGIGANSAIFNVIHAALMETVPVRDLAQLCWLRVDYPNGASARGFSYPFYKQLRQAGAFQDAICSFPVPLSLSATTAGGSVAERIQGEIVSGNYFPVLGIGAYLGHLITPDDDHIRGGHPVAVLSFDFWKSRFGADPAMVGREILLNNHRFTVIGISQPGYDGLEKGTAHKAVFAPMMMKPQLTPGWDALEQAEANWLWIVGRMRAGVPAAQAQAMADSLYHGVREQQIRAVPGLTVSQLQVELSGRIALRPLRDGGVGFEFRKPLVILMATVGLLLLIVCTNVANLLLARAAQNQKGIAVRLALGAGRARLAGQCLTEGLVLSAAGAAVGLLLAFWVNHTLLHFLVSPDVLNAIDLQPGWPVLLFTASVSVGAAILFSMAPALAAWKLDLNAGLKSAGATRRKARNVLVTAQISLAVILAVGATLFAGTLAKLRTVDIGFPAENLLLASIDPDLNGYTAEQRRSLITQLEKRLAALPGVRAASIAAIPTLAGDDYGTLFIPVGGDRDFTPNANAVGSGYFETMRIPVVLGRDFNSLDHTSGRLVAIINQALARRAFGRANPIGQRFRDGNDSGKARIFEIVGVAKDIRYRRPQEKETLDFVYVPYEQSNVLEREIVLHVRSAGDPLKLAGLVEREVHALDSNLPVFDVKTQEMQVGEMLDRERLIAVLSGLFGTLATLLAATGLYAVMAYSVARRTKEIGIRMAVGASANDVITLVLRETAGLTAAGILIGLPLAFGLARFAQSLLYEMRADDVRVFMGVALVVLAVGLTAGLWPARRASKTEPVAALRTE